MIRVLHTGDLHIGNFPGPEVNGENARYKDICKCLDALAAGAEAEKPDIAVIAGDVFHQARVWSDRGLKENQISISNIVHSFCPPFFRLEGLSPLISKEGSRLWLSGFPCYKILHKILIALIDKNNCLCLEN